jgi:hypothetical protein
MSSKAEHYWRRLALFGVIWRHLASFGIKNNNNFTYKLYNE